MDDELEALEALESVEVERRTLRRSRLEAKFSQSVKIARNVTSSLCPGFRTQSANQKWNVYTIFQFKM